MEHGLTCLALPTEDLANGSQAIDLGKSLWEFREESPCFLPWTSARKGQHKFAAFTKNWKLLRFLERCFCWDAFLSSFQNQTTVRRLECSMPYCRTPTSSYEQYVFDCFWLQSGQTYLFMDFGDVCGHCYFFDHDPKPGN